MMHSKHSEESLFRDGYDLSKHVQQRARRNTIIAVVAGLSFTVAGFIIGISAFREYKDADFVGSWHEGKMTLEQFENTLSFSFS